LQIGNEGGKEEKLLLAVEESRRDRIAVLRISALEEKSQNRVAVPRVSAAV